MVNISVVIPTCDRPEMLIEAINCVVHQSMLAHEIIVVNNGKKPLDCKTLPKQIIICELPPYIGASEARNQGAAIASGEYFAFLDDDDLWEMDYLRKVSIIIEDHYPDCIITRLDILVHGQIMKYKNSDGKLDLATLLVSNPGVGGSTTIVKNIPFVKISGYDPNLPTSEDKSLIIELMQNGYCVESAPHIQAIARFPSGARLTQSNSIYKGIKGFLDKYKSFMSFPQKNFNYLKVYYYRFLAKNNAIDYYLFWVHFLLNIYFSRSNLHIPEHSKLQAPRIILLIKEKLFTVIKG